MWHIGITPVLIIACAILFGLTSLCIIFFQFSLYLSGDSGGVYETWIQFSNNNEKTSFLMANFICMLPLAYICFASFYSFFKIKVHSFYALHAK